MRDAWRKAMRSVQNNKERLEVLEEELDGPRQELEERKKMEGKRRRKVENLRQEIQVCICQLGFYLVGGWGIAFPKIFILIHYVIRLIIDKLFSCV